MSDTLKCCYIPDEEQPEAGQGESMADAKRLGCQEDAEYEIRDVGDSNPYSCITHACGAHVGFLLGHNVGLPDDAINLWEVRELTNKEVNRAD